MQVFQWSRYYISYREYQDDKYDKEFMFQIHTHLMNHATDNKILFLSINVASNLKHIQSSYRNHLNKDSYIDYMYNEDSVW